MSRQQVLTSPDLSGHIFGFLNAPDCAVLAGKNGEKCRYPFSYVRKDNGQTQNCTHFCVRHLKWLEELLLHLPRHIQLTHKDEEGVIQSVMIKRNQDLNEWSFSKAKSVVWIEPVKKGESAKKVITQLSAHFAKKLTPLEIHVVLPYPIDGKLREVLKQNPHFPPIYWTQERADSPWSQWWVLKLMDWSWNLYLKIKLKA